jgi:hypothetical protein
MPGRTDRRSGRRRLAPALLLLFALLVPPAAAQQPSDAGGGDVAAWNALATSAEATVADADTPTDVLEALREKLVVQRAETLAAEQQGQPLVTELNQRLQALGPPPAEGTGLRCGKATSSASSRAGSRSFRCRLCASVK